MNVAEKKSIQKNIGMRIAMAREVAGFSQDELAKCVSLTRPQITNIELGNSDTTATMIVRIARALSIKPGRLLP